MTYEVGVFISHSWDYTDHYQRLAEWIFRESWSSGGTPIRFIDYSIPSTNPIHYARNERELRSAIYGEIAKAHVLVCPTGMYSSHSGWIQKELDGARQYGVKILAVNPWGQERKSSVVQKAADEAVGWTKDGVVNGIWRLYR